MIRHTDTPADQLIIAKALAAATPRLVTAAIQHANANLHDQAAQDRATEAAQLLEDLRRAIREAEAA